MKKQRLEEIRNGRHGSNEADEVVAELVKFIENLQHVVDAADDLESAAEDWGVEDDSLELYRVVREKLDE